MYKKFIIFLLLLFVACTSLKETILTENPEFIKHAYNFKITSPLAHNSLGYSKFVIEEINTKNVYEIEPRFIEPATGFIKFEVDKVGKWEEVISHKFSLSNPLNNKNYEVVGTITYIHIREKKGNTEEIYSIGPKEFIIFEGDTEVGKITIKDPDPTTILFNSKSVNIDYQKMMNKKSISFKNEDGILALIALETKEFIAVKYTGDIYIKQGLSSDERSDIVSMFLISDIVMSIVR